jgi:exoribonuclease-2
MHELDAIAARCNQQESAAKGAERHVQKAAVSHYLSTQIGTQYEALVTGDTKKGVFVRVIDPPIEGKLVAGEQDMDVGDHLRVQLTKVDIEKGHIDFARVMPEASGKPDSPWLVSENPAA